MFIAILGRQPELGIAELERVFSDVSWFSSHSAVITTNSLDIQRLGGTLKAGRIIKQLGHGDWRTASTQIVTHYTQAWANHEGKITLGISAYGFNVSPREIQKTGIILKGKLKSTHTSLRLVPNAEAALNTAASHHNKLGLSPNKVELLVVKGQDGTIIIAESIGAQNITALARRDQERPKRDAFVGMLPPKLAQIMINLTGPLQTGDAQSRPWLLDPFCGTGVVLQEASLLGYNAYGTDLSEKMIDYSGKNLEWLHNKFTDVTTEFKLAQGDAMTTQWQQPIDAVVCESYLGQPFSAPPSNSKLHEVRGNCDHIIGSFLKNIGAQLRPGTPLCVAVPAWRAVDGSFTHLPLIDKLSEFGYKKIALNTLSATSQRPTSSLLYYREDQIVARELLVLVKV